MNEDCIGSIHDLYGSVFFLNKIFTEFALYSFQWGFDVTSFLSFEVSINAIVETC